MSTDRDLRTSGPLVVAAGLIVVASVAATVTNGVAEPIVALAFGAFIAVGELLRIVLPGGRQAAPLADAGMLAIALLPVYPHAESTRPSIYLAVTIVTVGSVVGAFPSALAGRGMHLEELGRRVITTLVAASLFAPVLPHVAPDPQKPGWLLALAMLLAATGASVADAILAAALRSTSTHAPFRTAVEDEVRALLGISTAIAATGVLIALATPRMGLWALPVFAVPLLLTQFSFRRYATIDATYLQTIRSLSKVTEVGGYTETGHSRRVSRLAVMVAREMGVNERDLTDLEYAALMHDIGQLSLPEPIPGGATTMVAPVDQRRIASLGAEVIRQAGVLDRAALIVERQADPYRPFRGQLDTSLPIESRIIKAVNAYDDFVGASLESDIKLRAIERLQLGIDREYDPGVVDTLSRIVERQTELAY